MRRLVYLGVVVMLAGCGKQFSLPGEESLILQDAVRVLFTYGSAKDPWIKAVTDDFQRSQPNTAGGKPIHVDALAKGSGECIAELIAGTTHADLTSPVSSAFVKLGNGQSHAQTGRDLLGATENLVLSPVVIAMWQPHGGEPRLAQGERRLGDTRACEKFGLKSWLGFYARTPHRSDQFTHAARRREPHPQTPPDPGGEAPDPPSDPGHSGFSAAASMECWHSFTTKTFELVGSDRRSARILSKRRRAS